MQVIQNQNEIFVQHTAQPRAEGCYRGPDGSVSTAAASRIGAGSDTWARTRLAPLRTDPLVDVPRRPRDPHTAATQWDDHITKPPLPCLTSACCANHHTDPALRSMVQQLSTDGRSTRSSTGPHSGPANSAEFSPLIGWDKPYPLYFGLMS